jgi:hypothetical protein
MKIKISFLLAILAFSACSSGSDRKPQTEAYMRDWADTTLTVTGIGAPPSEAENSAQAQLLACNAAKMDAYRQLVEMIHGVKIDARTSVRDLISRNDSIRTESEGFVRRAKIIKQEIEKDGACQVTMELYLGSQFSNILNP